MPNLPNLCLQKAQYLVNIKHITILYSLVNTVLILARPKSNWVYIKGNTTAQWNIVINVIIHVILTMLYGIIRKVSIILQNIFVISVNSRHILPKDYYSTIKKSTKDLDILVNYVIIKQLKSQTWEHTKKVSIPSSDLIVVFVSLVILRWAELNYMRRESMVSLYKTRRGRPRW